MFWDKVAPLYPFYTKYINGKVNKQFVEFVASKINEDDIILECACGSGMITKPVARKCKKITATDYSSNMLNQTRKNCKEFSNITFEQANFLDLKYSDESFDKVIAGNVIHLVDNRNKALSELLRVCKTGGYLIIPTYINKHDKSNAESLLKFLSSIGINFKEQFTKQTYPEFFESNGLTNGEYKYIDGMLPSAIAVIKKVE
ncbi:MAG: class I SAM-dependent methyltransferase [Methanosphaera stadtmanae]|nr:class I SAM-dependent methyltransferase [Methanosphaera stadtmanae]